MSLRVRNFLGVKKADLNLQGILLVAGRNGAGKSSLIEAAAVAALRTAGARGMRTKKDVAQLLNNGAEAGSVVLDYGPGQIRVAYPDGTVEQSGRPEELGTALGIGAAKFAALKMEDRAREISDRFGTAPAQSDLVEWFRDHPGSGLNDEAISALWDMVDEQGWDAASKKAREHGTKLKGRWEAATGRQFGTQIARSWCPTILLHGEDYSLEEAQAQHAAAMARVDELSRANAVSGAERDRLRGIAEGIEPTKTKLRELEAEGERLSGEAEGLIAQRNSSEMPVDPASFPECPHCGRKVQLRRTGKQDYITLEKPAGTLLTGEDLKQARMRIAEVDGMIENVRNRITQNGNARTLAQRDVNDAERARNDLVRMQNRPVVTDEMTSEARQSEIELSRKVDAIKARDAAQRIHAEWLTQEAIIAALDADGVRKVVLERRLSEVNTRLDALSTAGKFASVAIRPDLVITYDGRPYVLLSESERWRCDLVIAALLGKQEGARVLLVDRLDVLHPQARPGALMLLHGLGIAALIGMTAKDPETVPDLAKARLGVNRWLDAGVLSA